MNTMSRSLYIVTWSLVLLCGCAARQIAYKPSPLESAAIPHKASIHVIFDEYAVPSAYRKQESTRQLTSAIVGDLSTSLFYPAEDPRFQQGEMRRGLIGVYLGPIDAEMQSTLELPDRAGALVTRVVEGSPAERAGLQVHDVIIGVDGTPTDTASELTTRISHTAPGTEVLLSLRRGGVTTTANVILGERIAEAELTALVHVRLRLRKTTYISVILVPLWFLGVPIEEHTATASVTLELLDSYNSRLGSYTGRGEMVKKVGLYTPSRFNYDRSHGGVASYALGDAVDHLKRSVLADRARIVSHLRGEGQVDSRPQERSPRFPAAAVSITGAAGALQQLTIGGPSESNPRLSPDGSWLLVQAEDQLGNVTLQKVSLVSAARVILTPTGSDSREGDWTPDGSAIVFATDRLGNYTLVSSLGTSGEAGVRFISPPSFSGARMPSVSPNGNNIAFSIGADASAQIAVIQTDGSNLRIFGEGSSPKWSPNGQRLLFRRSVGSYSHMYIMDSETGANLTEVAATQASDFDPSWSPDGSRIAFVSDRAGPRHHLYTTTVSGQVVTQLTEGEFDIGSASWGSDGSVYFSANAGGNWDVWRLKPIGP